jgi:hypothetical protein
MLNGLATAAFAAVNFVYAAVFGGPMDGTVWDVKMKEEGFFHWGSRRDTLIFARGRMLVEGEVAQGVATPLYEAAAAAGEATAFAATLEHPLRGRWEWVGKADGEKVSGHINVVLPDGRVKRLKFWGEKKS